MGESKSFTELQLAVLDVLWERGEANVGQVQAELQPARTLALTTVATVLSRLEKDGVVAHRAEGRQYVYRPLVTRELVRRSALSGLLAQLFAGDPTALVSHLLHDTTFSPDELAQVRALIKAYEQREEENHG